MADWKQGWTSKENTGELCSRPQCCCFFTVNYFWGLNFLTVSRVWPRRWCRVTEPCAERADAGTQKEPDTAPSLPSLARFTSVLKAVFHHAHLVFRNVCIECSYLRYPYYLLTNLSSILKSHTILIPLVYNVRTIRLLVKLSWSSATWSVFDRILREQWMSHLSVSHQ